MKKFERLPAESRKQEIKTAAIRIFLEKGFKATTMENIISEVTLSKGGVYRLYSSTQAILSDIILDGARARNDFYRQRALEKTAYGEQIDIPMIAEILCDGMLFYPEIAEIYTEFLIEKRRNPELELLYQKICRETTEQTLKMIEQMGLQKELSLNEKKMERLTDLMNTAILGIVILKQRDHYEKVKQQLLTALLSVLSEGDET
ncbi:MAG: TetR/AcrR family transcriptional regulator [Eubacteriales bacterium]|nr:TetR/AcrR family transcriptional regulator [Eubacteriales bacterium]